MHYTNLIWRNGQPYNEMFDDIYYSSDEDERISGQHEFEHVFFKNNGLPERWSDKGDFVIAELGFGSGLNCILTIREWLKHLDANPQKKRLHYLAFERYPLSPEAIKQLISRYPELKIYCDELIAVYPPAIKGSHRRHLFDNRVVIHYKFMDAYEALENENYNVDAWYLDGFSPAKNADMWSQSLFEKIAQNSHEGTTCSTYTAAGFVKRNLLAAGFVVDKVGGYGRKREMLVARLENCQPSSLKYIDKPWFLPPIKSQISDKRAVIIGAGIAGLCVAYSLVKRGWKVTVIDARSEGAKTASSNPAAIVYPRLSVNSDIDTEFYTEAYCYALYILNMLQNRYKEKLWFDCGLLQFIDKKRISGIISKYQFNSDFVNIIENPGDSSLANRFIDDSDLSCVDFKTAGVVVPQVLCAILAQECGEQLDIIDADVSKIKHGDKRWQCFSGEQLVHEAEVLVIANGVHINDLGLDVTFPIEPIRGQVAVLKQKSKSDEIVQAVNADVYLSPLIDNKHYLGATYTRENGSMEIDHEDNKTLIDGLNKIYPDVFSLDDVDESWVGFRAMSKDRVPIAGAVPDVQFYDQHYADIKHGRRDDSYPPAMYLPGLYISAAHGSRGFTTGFLCAEVIASQIEGEPSPVSRNVLDYLSPSRFVVNDLKRGR